jgi:hypothetical protein
MKWTAILGPPAKRGLVLCSNPETKSRKKNRQKNIPQFRAKVSGRIIRRRAASVESSDYESIWSRASNRGSTCAICSACSRAGRRAVSSSWLPRRGDERSIIRTSSDGSPTTSCVVPLSKSLGRCLIPGRHSPMNGCDRMSNGTGAVQTGGLDVSPTQ